MISRQEILDRLDMLSYYRRELPSLKVKGEQGKAKCPFHNDSNPSLSIDLQRGLFICFGCGVKGSLYDFHMRRYEMEFKYALKDLADLAGVSK